MTTKSEGEIPVWVSGQQLWVRGVDRKTTCNDVITALLGRHEDGYVIVERWRRVERPLGGDTRLLKLWTTWGDARHEVKLSLRRVSDDDSGRGSPSSAVSRRRKHHHHHHRQKKDTQTVHPKRLAQLSKTQSIERLLKLILVQGETIQSQLQRLHDREDQIEQLEDETHKARVSVLGSDYVLQTYLGGDPTSTPSTSQTYHHEENDSGVVTEGTPTGENACTPTEDTKEDDDDPTIEEDIEAEITDLQKRIELWEKVLKVNKKLEKEEENLVRLYVNFKRCGEMEVLQNELDQKQEQLERGARQLEINNCSLLEADSALEARQRYLRILQSELDASDQETERLLKASDPRNVHHTRLKYSRDFDSNSDTGLSSLHSSSEEGTYVLDTLV
ncbi:hypothetical protein LSTR_LSTR003442 [Laodelphax striatellus]|uniref:Ras association domain-containing protein n=1 Tax=Laodelphax striatellus TaxID=195883 RepID=A0A482WZE8_LAOST|nr:hypothetical protein LSTR_LSTR003442 [Laodelphax striatellus]